VYERCGDSVRSGVVKSVPIRQRSWMDRKQDLETEEMLSDIITRECHSTQLFTRVVEYVIYPPSSRCSL